MNETVSPQTNFVENTLTSWRWHLLSVPSFQPSIHTYHIYPELYSWDWNIMHILMNQLLNYSVFLSLIQFNRLSVCMRERAQANEKDSNVMSRYQQQKPRIPDCCAFHSFIEKSLLRVYALEFSPLRKLFFLLLFHQHIHPAISDSSYE